MALQKFLGKGTLETPIRLIPEIVYNELAIKALQKHPKDRCPIEIQYMCRYFKQNDFFQSLGDDIIQRSCQVMKFEEFQEDEVIYRRSESIGGHKLYLIYQGEMGIYLNKPKVVRNNLQTTEQIEIMAIKQYSYFGSQLFVITKDDYFEIPGLVIKAKRQCRAASIDHHCFTQELMNLEIQRITAEVSRLYRFPIFAHITYQLLRKFFLNSFKMTYQFQEVVYQQGQIAEVVYLIISGQFELRKDYSKISILSSGELIGEQEIMQEKVYREYSIVCTSEEGSLLAFDSQFFRSYVFQMIKGNVDQVLQVKDKFRSNAKIDHLRESLTKMKELVIPKQDTYFLRTSNKKHFTMKPKVHIIEDSGEQPSYYQLYVDMYQKSKSNNNKAHNERHRRLSQYIKNTLKPHQQSQQSIKTKPQHYVSQSMSTASPFKNSLIKRVINPSFFISKPYQSIEFPSRSKLPYLGQ